jgi:hypothetical protein
MRDGFAASTIACPTDNQSSLSFKSNFHETFHQKMVINFNQAAKRF